MDIVRIRVSAVILNSKKILLVRGSSGFYKDFYFTPGGKVEEGETELQALSRELMEEMSTNYVSEDYLFEYETKNWDGGTQKVRCYLLKLEIDSIKLSGEIDQMIWYGREDFEKGEIPISESMGQFLMPKLIADGLI